MNSENAFETATLGFLDSLYRTALRMVHDPKAAAQCVQRTYSRACHSFEDLPDGTDHRVWMFRTMLRDIHERPRAWLSVAGWFGRTHDSNQDPILQTLDFIPEECREVMLLADVEGFNKRQIQEILEISSEQVSSRLMEGRVRLRAGLAGFGGQDGSLIAGSAVA